MKIEVFPSASGDCLLLTSSDGTTLLADAGLPGAYERFIARSLARLRNQGRAIDVAYVSHIDRDHIGGILKLLDHEVKWRVYEHSIAQGRRRRKPRVPRPPKINQIWHNAFLERIEESEDISLSSVLDHSAQTLKALDAAGLGTIAQARAAAKTEMLALSVGDAIEVNWRIGPNQLDIPLNPQFEGEFMTARVGAPISVGSMNVTVLGPTATELKELRDKKWIPWLRAKKKYLKKLKRQHADNVKDMRSSEPAMAIAARQRELAAQVEKDVTPPNLASLVLLVEEGGKRILLTGDAGDETLIQYLRDANLLDSSDCIYVDVLKVPHHGAHNSFSSDFAKTVRAAHYVFCGDGEHHNPEPDVVRGYLNELRERPIPPGSQAVFWFNWSLARTSKHKKLWRDIEALFTGRGTPPRVRGRYLRANERRMLLNLS